MHRLGKWTFPDSDCCPHQIGSSCIMVVKSSPAGHRVARALAMNMTKPSGPAYRRASERSHNAASMLLFLGTRVRRVVGDVVAEARQVCKPLNSPLCSHRVIVSNSRTVSTVAKPSRRLSGRAGGFMRALTSKALGKEKDIRPLDSPPLVSTFSSPRVFPLVIPDDAVVGGLGLAGHQVARGFLLRRVNTFALTCRLTGRQVSTALRHRRASERWALVASVQTAIGAQECRMLATCYRKSSVMAIP